ncbi:MAG: ComEC/Rec2 family competence protein [Armatimonadetes bacterium]|nr:ComEC/Rec2 family competence protein [Anaerolineae bacterium]
MRLVYLTLSWTLGILLAGSMLPLTPSAWLILAVSFSVVLFALRHQPEYRFAVLLLLMGALGGLRMALHPATSPVTAFNNTGGLTIEGVISAAPDVRDDRTLLRLDAATVIRGGEVFTSSGTVLVQAPRLTAVAYGERVRTTGTLITPAEYDTFSYADYLARGGVFSIMPNAIVESVSAAPSEGFYTTLTTLRLRAAEQIAAYLPEPQAGLLTGILLGNERGIAVEVAEAFSIVGASHVIAISGFNMAVLGELFAGFFQRVLRRRWLAGIAALLVIAIYTLFVGANASVVRAAVMSGLVIIAGLLRRRTYLPASLAFAALLMSIQNPTVLSDLSFQFSFFATLGLALFADPLQTRFDALLTRWYGEVTAVRLSGILGEPLVVTVAALAFTLPLTVAYFGRVSLLVLPVNLLIVPIQVFILFTGGLATLLAFVVPALAQIAFWICLAPLSWTIEVVRAFARLPLAQLSFTLDPRLMYAGLGLIIGGAMMQAAQPPWWRAVTGLVTRQATITTTVICGLVIASLTFSLTAARPDGQLHVWLLDVGHTNAVLLQTPGGAQLLVDGGRFPARLLTALGDRLPFNDQTLEAVIITQPDEFQYGALPAVLARYETGVVLTNGQPNLSPTFTTLQASLAGRQVIPVTAGYRLEADDGFRLEVLHPQTAPSLDDAIADGALTIQVSYGDVSFLLTSGLSVEGQLTLLDAGAYPLATVLQLPRHGGVRSLADDFWAAAQPSLALLQSDRANTFGDPHPDTLALVGDTALLRTDLSGAVHLWTDGQRLWAQPER